MGKRDKRRKGPRPVHCRLYKYGSLRAAYDEAEIACSAVIKFRNMSERTSAIPENVTCKACLAKLTERALSSP